MPDAPSARFRTFLGPVDGLPVASLVIFAVGGLMYLAMSAATRSTMSTRAIAVRRPGWIARRRARGGIAPRRGHVGCRLSSADRPGPSDRKKRVKWVLDADLRDFLEPSSQCPRAA